MVTNKRCIEIIEERKDWLEQMKTTPDDNGKVWNEQELQHQIDCCDALIEKIKEESEVDGENN